MPYYLHHNISFRNPLTEHIRVELYKKDVVPTAVTNLKATGFHQSYPKGNNDKFSNVIASEISFELWLTVAGGFHFYDFIVTYPDEWKVIAYSDEQIVFVGFLTPGEGTAEFQNLPYSTVLNAIDGLGLLKGIPLTDAEGDNFTGVNLLLDYIVAILGKTDLGLDIRIYSSWIESTMTDRLTDSNKDTFNQTGLHARTFLSNAIEFYDCYEALTRICDKYFQIYQWQGRWVILNIGEMQTGPGPRLWYTEYDSDGNVTDSDQADENPCPVGIDKIIHPRDRTEFIGSEYAVKSAKTNYTYTPWPEIPTNNKFDRLTPFFVGPLGSLNFIDDWEYGKRAGGYPFPLTNSGDLAFLRIQLNIFGVEESREIVVQQPASGTGQIWLRCQPIPVNQNDIVRINFNKRFNADFTAFDVAMRVYIDTGSDFWALSWGEEDLPGNRVSGTWVQNNLVSVIHEFIGSDDATKFTSFSIEPKRLPVDGNMYIAFEAAPQSGVTEHIYDNFSFEYIPYINGSYRQVLGDYWNTAQSANFKDTIDEEIYISDSPKKILKGALYRSDLATLTTPTWHRDNITEERHFKELGNLSRYNHQYRRMWKITGLFSGLKWQPDDDTQLFEPLSFHRHFYFPDKTILGGKYFMLVPPLRISHSKGTFSGTFIEVLDSNLTSEGAQTAGQIVQLLIQEINDIFSGLTFSTAHADPDKLIVYTEDANTVTVLANDNGVGNSPSLTIISTINLPGPSKQITIQVGADIQPTNSFTVTIAGTPATVVSTATVTYQEGNEVGDTHEFKYKFQ